MTLNYAICSTFSKEDFLAELEKRGVDGLRLYRLGLIDTRPDELFKSVHYAVGMNDDEHVKVKSSEKPSQEKRKGKKLQYVEAFQHLT